MSSSINYSDLLARADAILKTNSVKPGFGGTTAMFFTPSQPYHWLGFAVLRRQPVLWLALVVFALGTGLLVRDVFAVFHLSPHSLSLMGLSLPSLFSWLGQASLYESRAGLNGLVLFVFLAAVPWMMIGNVLLAVACGAIGGVRPRWGWLWSMWLGMLPLRFVAGWFMPQWKFWGGEWRGLMAVNARILQFSAIYGVVHQLSEVELQEKWLALMERRFKEVWDSLYSYVYVANATLVIAGAIVVGVVMLLNEADIGGSVIQGIGPQVLFDGVFVAFAIWSAMSRFLLGVTIFRLLDDPGFEAPVGNRWVRLVKMSFVVLVMNLVVVAV